MLIAALSGCATPVIMLKNDRTGQVARCGGGTTGFMAGGLIGQSIEKNSDAACVHDYEALGFRRTSELAEGVATAANAQPPAPQSKPPATSESKWIVSAEGVAKATGCPPRNTSMASKGTGTELFAVACPDGTTLAIRCEIDGCRVLR